VNKTRPFSQPEVETMNCCTLDFTISNESRNPYTLYRSGGTFISCQLFYIVHRELVKSFLDTMKETGADFTNSFRFLSQLDLPGMPCFTASKTALLQRLLEQCCTLEELIKANRPKMDTKQVKSIDISNCKLRSCETGRLIKRKYHNLITV
jgi:hypothetical protein